MAEHGFPEMGRSNDDLLGEIAELRGGDLDWRGGKAFSLVYDVEVSLLWKPDGWNKFFREDKVPPGLDDLRLNGATGDAAKVFLPIELSPLLEGP